MGTKLVELRYCSVWAVVAVICLGGCVQKTPDVVAYTETARQSDEAPNIVLMVANQLGYGDLGCYGQQLIQTPNIDRLAADGCRFTCAYAGGDSSVASLWTLMTGRYTALAVQDGKPSFQLSRDQKTLADVMRLTEYTTGFVGSWGLGGDSENTPPSSHGFDEWSGLLGPATAETTYPATIWSNGEQVPLAQNAEGKQGIALTDALTNEAIAFLERHTSGKPFLLVISYPLPGSDLALAESGTYADRDWTAAQKAYAERIACLDRDVGALVEKLEELELSKRTAIVFTSDCAARHDGAEPDIFDSNAGLRTAVSEMYEGRLRVPLIVKWPAEVTAGSQTDFAATTWDMMATFTDMAGAVLPAGSTNGVSFVPALLGKSKSRRGMLYWETREGGFGQGVRIGDWKAVRPCGKMGIEAVELYNVKEDPRETKNQAKEHPEIVARFIKS
ncbi:MAG: sulfatase-like hydrolase/transferase [Pirellulaceae bacterium]|nr:sulfatase-like hydrolase/transferase [Pirellulaceae bacterium]